MRSCADARISVFAFWNILKIRKAKSSSSLYHLLDTRQYDICVYAVSRSDHAFPVFLVTAVSIIIAIIEHHQDLLLSSPSLSMTMIILIQMASPNPNGFAL